MSALNINTCPKFGRKLTQDLRGGLLTASVINQLLRYASLMKGDLHNKGFIREAFTFFFKGGEQIHLASI